jgi:ABC-2 type transport system permease protein
MNTFQTSHSMTTFGWLVKREYWESRRGFLWAPFWAAAVIIIVTILGIIAAEVLRARLGTEHVYMGGISLSEMLRDASTHDLDQFVKALDATMLLFGSVIAVVLSFVIFFYLLGALYDDRKDRSILFWKSLPLSDSGTVLSKVFAGIIVAPLIAVGVVLAGYLAMLVILTLWLLAHGVNPFGMVWAHVEPFSIWLHLLVMIGVNAVWALPTVGWLLLWSAAVRSKPFLWAIIIPVVAGVLNIWVGLLGLPHVRQDFYWGQIAARLLLSVVPGGWVNPDNTGHSMHFGELSAISFPAMGQAFATPQMWIGAAVGIVLIAAAIWFRRWRDEA